MAAYSIPNQYSPPDHYSSFSSEFCSLPICEQTSDLFNNMAPFMNYDINSVVPQMSEIETGFSNFAVNCVYQNDHHQVFEPGDVCINGPYMAAENWVLKDNNQVVTKVEETEVKVGRYSAEERKERILRYLKKRNQRNFNKTIKYACRKTLADKRVRVRGRFAKNNESTCEEEIVMNTSDPHKLTSYEPINNLSNFVDSIHMKYEEDCWFEAAMANLMYLPNYC
ncbi:hypothetical protein CASFOL_013981 [Castilleja foliolosa]|uniref:CCT domain-containing protein n=1 Tax=Castilleja foliolosa TaxID=1961234 RepID=A0ABD3DQL3_9LAMI